LIFIGLNKVATVPFVYFLLRFALHEPRVILAPQQVNFVNALVPIPCLFIIYDFFYTILHWALHIQSIYGYIHKHHHHQKAPSRANVDAVNVHPIEFFLGEYNHLLAVFLYTRVLNQTLHFIVLPIFLALGAVMAGWNHTRFDVHFSFKIGRNSRWTLFDSKYHDVHHRIPQSNYGQYIMLWDHIFGTFRYVYRFFYILLLLFHSLVGSFSF
jgi:sterol desaturase/sphingolipid hydroxylase (fatty acid hydroxylase superfamily)